MYPLRTSTTHSGNAANGATWLATILPGILVAATGVGAGDLLTASIAGSRVGLSVLWAAAFGALLKWVLNEGIARWQMATGTTLLEGWATRLGAWTHWVFLLYFVIWSFMVGGALINACGVAGAALVPLGDANQSKIIWGIVHSLVGLAMVWLGGFKFFEKVMAACIAFMFVGVLVTAALLAPDWAAVARGTLVPSVQRDGLPWILGVLGGVGGTVTLLSYGYWIRETGRTGREGVRICRIDLAVAYALSALFGMGMILIGSRIVVQGQGTQLAAQLGEQLGLVLGPAGKWMFLLGFWGAVFSSLLGVWQSAPYLFADFLRLRARGGNSAGRADRDTPLHETAAYRTWLVAIAIVPLVTLWVSVQRIQLGYAIMGACFMPLLALTLLILNNHPRWLAREFRTGMALNALLAIIVLLFAWMGYLQVTGRMPSTGA